MQAREHGTDVDARLQQFERIDEVGHQFQSGREAIRRRWHVRDEGKRGLYLQTGCETTVVRAAADHEVQRLAGRKRYDIRVTGRLLAGQKRSEELHPILDDVI